MYYYYYVCAIVNNVHTVTELSTHMYTHTHTHTHTSLRVQVVQAGRGYRGNLEIVPEVYKTCVAFELQAHSQKSLP